MNYCPGCQEPIDAQEEQCPFCGYELLAVDDEPKKPGESGPQKKSFFKSAAFIGPLIAFFVFFLVGVGAYFGYRYYQEKQGNDSKKAINLIWNAVTNRSEQLSGSMDSVSDYSDLADLEDELSKFSEFLASKQTEAMNLETAAKHEGHKENLVKAIEKYSKYIYLLKLVLQKEASEVTTEDYSKIKNISSEASDATENFTAEALFIESELPDNLFKAIDDIRKIIEDVKKENATKKKEEEEQKQNQERKAAEQTVSSFEQARIDRSGAQMRRYITPEYGKVFDPEQEFAVTDSYLIDFKIIKTERKEDNSYEISGDETGKDMTGKKFTNQWWFKVINYQEDWLIDNRKLLN